MPRRKLTQYEKRTRNVKMEYGENAFKKWGKKGGNPDLLKKKKR
jgi:hypothetical protein